MAATCNKHELYAQSVQAVDTEVVNLIAMRRQISSSLQTALSLREDFCGTAVLCHAWCSSFISRVAYGIDNDPAVISYARTHTLNGDDASSRVQLTLGSVTTPRHEFKTRIPRVDIIAGLNYGICYFYTRKELLLYLTRCRDGLRNGGAYIFEQSPINPMTNLVAMKLHFSFSDGSQLRNAFGYDFRIWTIPEVREAMNDAGFRNIHVWMAPFPDSKPSKVASQSEEDDEEDTGDDESDDEGGETESQGFEYRRVEGDHLPQMRGYNVYMVATVGDFIEDEEIDEDQYSS
ncbi:hypothetical protein SmJEL517_g05761 [Synchytrium microbalum]|uniref:Methyltransferase domain-containing protein n=1 Tax=Synchytrium microbalum TaxID=1806994 RepID=A0A507BZQ4_9FUNG|nr:uncharacterized protein SmJEL517_g05761 [Synchytrium microbalum]TPX30743.1 hypothetical protein SmJEL517_g05761 [Synchytrium microbalum]